MEVKIQQDYHSGNLCVENEVPWMVPGSIYKLDELCLSDDVVLEVGTGGSTLFFARRCRKVVAIETDYNWYTLISNEINKRKISNIVYLYCPKQDDIEGLIDTLDDNFNIISVDSKTGYNRSRFLNYAVNKNAGRSLRVIVLDNYADSAVFPEHFNLSLEEMAKKCGFNDFWSGDDFEDNWVGKGTRIIYKMIDRS